jgi:ABC-type sulfate transport system permease component
MDVFFVMPALVAGIDVLGADTKKTWMASKLGLAQASQT